MNTLRLLTVVAAFVIGGNLGATEPNEFFEQSTILPPGVLSVNDSLTPGGGGGDFPDTMVASLSSFGTFITGFNDDGGPWEGSLGSALYNVPINNDSSFWFTVTGHPDFDFNGSHDQSGSYRVFVDIYDNFGFFEETFDFDGTLSPGEVDSFSMDGFNTTYTYNVEIDNTIGGGGSPGDVDFFTFTGLVPGASFSAETMELGFTGIDTYLGWFDDFGNVLATNDDIEPGNLLSLIEGVVPASGKLTFAVTGYGDVDFLGFHNENAEYSLELTIGGAGGDFDNDGDVDGRDFLIWQRGGSPSFLSAGDLADWQTNYGAGALHAVTAVPEPAAFGLLVAAISVCGIRRRLPR